jgi:hypothetical protein
VRLALWCEAHGLTAERLHHLTLAVLADPKNAAARGLMGLVSHNGRWQRPEAVADKVKADADLAARLAEYNGRRAKAPDTAEAQWRLALWCEENGLKPEATAHLTAVVRLDPSHENAWKRLGCKKYGGRWLNDAAIAAEKADAEAQKQADKKWKPLLERYRDALRGKDEAKRAEAEKALDELTDPRASRWVWVSFATAGAWGQAVAVRVLGQIDAAPASRALALLSVFGETAEVRRAATETLKQRDPREFAGLLIGLLQDEIKYEVRPVNGPGSPGVLFVQGQKYNVQRLYAPPAMPNIPLYEGEPVTFDGDGFAHISRMTGVYGQQKSASSLGHLSYQQFLHPNLNNPVLAEAYRNFSQNGAAIMRNFWNSDPTTRIAFQSNPALFNRVFSMNVFETTTQPMGIYTDIPIGRIAAEYQKTAATAQQQLANDVAAIDDHNVKAGRLNVRVSQVLSSISGKDLGKGREPWKAWFVNLKGYSYTATPEQPRPTLVQNVPLAYQPQPIPTVSTSASIGKPTTSLTMTPQSRISCFGAGTPVRTLDGSRPIESLRVGDRVLTQSTETGALGYRPVVGVYHNPPSPTFLIKVAGDTIVSSPFHRFWKAGKGWVMARDIRVGDRLRLLEGVSEVTGVEDGKVQLVYNLDVAGDADFFAGNAGALVHDNTLPDPRLAPFDAQALAPDVAKAK